MHNSYSNRGGRRPYSGGGGGRRYSRGSGGHRFGGVQRSRGPADERINESRFINKVVITEEAERFTPEHTFQDFDIHPRLKAEIAAKGYVLPTPIQDKAIPHVLQGADVVGTANTGTGKTAAFLIPLIHKAVTDRSQKTLIVVPTRELAIQIEQELRSLTSGAGIYSVTCVGGAAIGPQLAKLRMENDFIIGTPGRLKDLIERKRINLAMFKNIVLDEADRMLDMGFCERYAFSHGWHAERAPDVIFFGDHLARYRKTHIGIPESARAHFGQDARHFRRMWSRMWSR